jgi:hypothetical protein
MALRAMIARQGLTGVNPMTGGLPGIMAREAVDAPTTSVLLQLNSLPKVVLPALLKT